MRKLAAPFLLFLLCVGFYWRLTLTSQYTFLDSPDLANLDLPRLQFQASAWRHSQLPLWDPYQWNGQPFLGQVTGAAYPANWLLGFFPFRDGKLNVTVVHWYLVLIHFQAALFCYFLCRECKRSHAASILGGLVFSLGGFMGTTEWPQILNGALWLPLVLLFLFRALRGRQALYSASLSGAFLGIAWLSGHHEVPIYASTAIAFVWLAAVIHGPERGGVLRLALAAAFATALIAAVQILPAQEYAPLAKRWVGLEDPIGWKDPIPYTIHEHYSWSIAAIPGIITPRPPVHVNPFIGIVAFALALLGLHHGWRRLPQVRILVLIALAGVLLALAGSSFIHGLLYAVLPVFGKARVPARALALFSFAIAPLAAYGLDALQRRSSPWLRRTILTLAAVSLYLFLNRLPPATAPDPALLTALTAAVGATLFAAWRVRAAAAIVVLVLFEISNVAGRDFANQLIPSRPGYLDRLYQHNDIASFLRSQPQPIRAHISDAHIPYNFGDWHAIQTTEGFAASVTANLLDLERHKPRVQDLLGVTHFVAKAPPRPDLVEVSQGASGVNVYHNAAAFPRAWIVHKATQAASSGAINLRLDDPAFQARTEALLLTAPPTLETCAGPEDAAVVPSASPNQVRINATLACRGLLILSETHFPGWHATVDGQPAEIIAPFGALRGIVVGKGSHTIEFTFQPNSAIAGATLTALGVLFVFWTRRQSIALEMRYN